MFRTIRFVLPAALALPILTGAFFATAASAAADDIDMTPVKKWVERQSKIKTLVVDFTQKRYLKTVKKPLETSGKFFFAAPGSIRWQSGDPPKVIATVKKDGDLTVLHLDKKEAEVMTRQQLNDKTDGQGVAFLESGFPRDLDSFLQRFEVTSVAKDHDYFRVEAKFANSSNAIVRKFVFLIHEGTWILGGLQFHFRDGSRVESTFTKFVENQPVADSQFTPDLAGFAIKKAD
jgi:outer membrane lipoprotein-sorting protein